jgi:hypothetical protein
MTRAAIAALFASGLLHRQDIGRHQNGREPPIRAIGCAASDSMCIHQNIIRESTMKKSTLALALLSALTASAVFAGNTGYNLIPGAGATSETKTRAYVGLNWNLGGGTTPALVLGVFRTKVKSDGDTSGGNLAFHVNLAGGIKPGKLKLGYLNGKEDFQGEVGVGYDFLKNAPLLGVGVNAPHVSAGVDAYANPGFVPHFTLHGKGEFDMPSGTSSQCVYTSNSTTTTYSDANCTTLKQT